MYRLERVIGKGVEEVGGKLCWGSSFCRLRVGVVYF